MSQDKSLKQLITSNPNSPWAYFREGLLSDRLYGIWLGHWIVMEIRRDLAFLDQTVLISVLGSFIIAHRQNAPVKLRRRHQMNFIRD